MLVYKRLVTMHAKLEASLHIPYAAPYIHSLSACSSNLVR